MQQNNSEGQNRQHPDDMTGRGHGGQGIDKAPGEETAQDDVNFSQEAFKGKKVDADPSKESDRPADQSL